MSILAVGGLALTAVCGALTPVAADQIRPSDGAICYGTDPHVYTYCVPPAGRGGTPKYGAIAVTNEPSRFFGISYQWPSRGGAENEALNQCDKDAGLHRACKIAVWFYDRCGALAMSTNNDWGADSGQTARAAGQKALKLCREEDESGTCKVVRSFCSR